MTKPSDTATSDFTRGPSIVPGAALLTWLDGTHVDVGQRKIRIPVWMDVSAMGVKDARIGAADDADAVRIKLDDGSLGISVADHARRATKAGGPAALWLEGKWKGGGKFSVTRVVRAIPAAEAAEATFVEVEP